VVGCGLGVGGELFRFGFDGGGRRFGLFFPFLFRCFSGVVGGCSASAQLVLFRWWLLLG
jgi:hypothetical protein